MCGKEMWSKKGKRLFVIWGLCLAIFTGIFWAEAARPVEAAKGYTELNVDEGKPSKSGNYYFKYKNGSIYMAAKKNGTYKKTPMTLGAYSNGKQAYYVKDNALYKYVYKSKKKTKLKKLPAGMYDEYDPMGEAYISTIYGNKIFMSGIGGTYVYNIKTKKIKKAAADRYIHARHGKYVVACEREVLDAGGHKNSLYIYKITSGGMKKVKRLTQYCGTGYCFVKGKLYYESYSSNLNQFTLYRCEPNGTKKKKLGTFKGKNGTLYLESVTSKYCIIYKGGQRYKYTYATKKLKKI